MHRMICAAAIVGVVASLALSGAALADGTRTIKFESIATTPGTSGGGASCKLSSSAGAETFQTPARIAVAVDGDGNAMVSSLSCSQGGVSRSFSAIPGSKTTIVVIDFSGGGTEFWFERSDGGVVGRVAGGRFTSGG